MESKRRLSKFLTQMDTTNSDLLDSQNYSNFQLFGIGKETAAQKARREKLKKSIEDAKKNIKGTVKDINTNIKQTTKDVVKNDNLKKSLKANFLTYNPAVAIPRSSALLAFRVNLFGVSSRLYPAFLDEAALRKGNFNVQNAQNAKVAWEQVANFWEDKIGGDRKKLQEAISGAWNKPVFKTVKSQARRASTANFSGDSIFDDINQDTLFGDVGTFYEKQNYSNEYSAAAIGAYISAGLSVVGGIVKMIGDKGAKKNPYNEGTPEYDNFNNQLQSGGTPPPLNISDLNKIIEAARLDKGKGLDNTGLDLEQLNNEDGSGDDKILGMPKTAFWIGIGVVALIGGYFIYKKIIKK